MGKHKKNAQKKMVKRTIISGHVSEHLFLLLKQKNNHNKKISKTNDVQYNLI